MRAVLDPLEARSIPWHPTGSEALSAYGSPRQTLDTDIVLATTPAVLEAIAAALDHPYLDRWARVLGVADLLDGTRRAP